MPLTYEKKAETLKTPGEFGIPTLQRMYTALRQQWFAERGDTMGVEFPVDVEFTFGNTDDYLGEFKANIQYMTAPDGAIHEMTSTDYEIEFSNQFRLTPFQLMNVMAHEMIHLLLTMAVTRMATEGAAEGKFHYRQLAEDEMGHGEEFRKLADEINRDLGLQVTVTNDQPIIQDGVASRSIPAGEKEFLLVAPADQAGAVNVVGMAAPKLRKAVMKLREGGMQFRILSTAESHVIMKYFPDSDDMVKTSTVPESYLSELEDSGVVKDETGEYLENTGKEVQEKLLCVTVDGQVMVSRCTPETSGSIAGAVAAATGKPVGIYGVTDRYNGNAPFNEGASLETDWKELFTASSESDVQRMVDGGEILPEAEVSPDGRVEAFSDE